MRTFHVIHYGSRPSAVPSLEAARSRMGRSDLLLDFAVVRGVRNRDEEPGARAYLVNVSPDLDGPASQLVVRVHGREVVARLVDSLPLPGRIAGSIATLNPSSVVTELIDYLRTRASDAEIDPDDVVCRVAEQVTDHVVQPLAEIRRQMHGALRSVLEGKRSASDFDNLNTPLLDIANLTVTLVGMKGDGGAARAAMHLEAFLRDAQQQISSAAALGQLSASAALVDLVAASRQAQDQQDQIQQALDKDREHRARAESRLSVVLAIVAVAGLIYGLLGSNFVPAPLEDAFESTWGGWIVNAVPALALAIVSLWLVIANVREGRE